MSYFYYCLFFCYFCFVFSSTSRFTVANLSPYSIGSHCHRSGRVEEWKQKIIEQYRPSIVHADYKGTLFSGHQLSVKKYVLHTHYTCIYIINILCHKFTITFSKYILVIITVFALITVILVIIDTYTHLSYGAQFIYTYILIPIYHMGLSSFTHTYLYPFIIWGSVHLHILLSHLVNSKLPHPNKAIALMSPHLY